MALTPTDTIILVIVAVIIIFGASKLPEIFRNLGRSVGEFKKGQLEAEMELAQMQQQLQQQQPTSREKELETKIQELQKQLEELKKQAQNQSQSNK